MYTAVVLDFESRTALLKEFEKFQLEQSGFQTKNAQGHPLTHHVTLNMGKIDEKLNSKDLIGETVEFKVVSFGCNNQVAAFAVEHQHGKFGFPSVQTSNKSPHITAAINIANGGKPFKSNELFEQNNTNWAKLELTVKGTVQEVQ